MGHIAGPTSVAKATSQPLPATNPCQIGRDVKEEDTGAFGHEEPKLKWNCFTCTMNT